MVGVTDEELAWLAMMAPIKSTCWEAWNDARQLWKNAALTEDLRERLYEAAVTMNAAVQQDAD
jgi:hypothetical protein